MKAKKKTKNAKKVGTTLVSYLLDETGSMARVIAQTINGFNEYIHTLQKDKAGKYQLWLKMFNSARTTDIYKGPVGIQEAVALSRSIYRPTNATPLYDAIGDQIEAVKKRNHKEAILFVIQTDGEENSSRRYDRAEIFRLIDELQKKGWQFVFLGADQDAYQAASLIGIAGANTMSYSSGDTQGAIAMAGAATVMYSRQSGGQQVNSTRLMDDAQRAAMKKKRLRK